MVASATDGAEHVLIYQDAGFSPGVYMLAVEDLGWSYTLVVDGADFKTALQTGAYTHVISARQFFGAAGIWEDDLVAWAVDNPGKPVIITDWRVSNPQPYLLELGFWYTGNTNLTSVWGLPGRTLEDLASPLMNPGWLVYSYGVTGPRIIAVDIPTAAGKPIAAQNGCWFFNGFLADTFVDLDVGIEIVQRQLLCEDCNKNGIADDVETEPLELVDPDAAPTAACHDAPLIGPGIVFEGSSVTAELLQPGGLDPFFCGLLVGVEDVFYRYIPCWDGLVFITVEGPPINWLYGVYDDCPPTSESLIACNEIDHFEVIFHAEKGKEYWLRIAGQFFITGSFELSMLGPDTQLNPTDCNFNRVPDECECLADVNGDHVVNEVDLGLVLAALGATCDGCPEDVDGSGVVDPTDYVIVSQSQGPCPFADWGT